MCQGPPLHLPVPPSKKDGARKDKFWGSIMGSGFSTAEYTKDLDFEICWASTWGRAGKSEASIEFVVESRCPKP